MEILGGLENSERVAISMAVAWPRKQTGYRQVNSSTAEESKDLSP